MWLSALCVLLTLCGTLPGCSYRMQNHACAVLVSSAAAWIKCVGQELVCGIIATRPVAGPPHLPGGVQYEIHFADASYIYLTQ
jgi:hypothetical protein